MRISVVRRQRDDGKGMEAQTVKLTAEGPEDVAFLHETLLDAEKHVEDTTPSGKAEVREYEAARLTGDDNAQVQPGEQLTTEEVQWFRVFKGYHDDMAAGRTKGPFPPLVDAMGQPLQSEAPQG